MTITHHPELESLMSCSAGSMPEAFAAVMAAHIEMCPACRKELALMEEIGVAMFDRVPPVQVARTAPVNAVHAMEAEAPDKIREVMHSDVPRAISGSVGHILDSVPWKRVSPGVWQHQIALNHPDRGDLRLIKVGPGQKLPEHTHNGSEITLVLRGAYEDVTGRYVVGDVADLGDDVDHAPIADAKEGCICLIATEHPLKFKGRMARLIQPLIGI